jgi:hypothetical protein
VVDDNGGHGPMVAFQIEAIRAMASKMMDPDFR